MRLDGQTEESSSAVGGPGVLERVAVAARRTQYRSHVFTPQTESNYAWGKQPGGRTVTNT